MPVHKPENFDIVTEISGCEEIVSVDGKRVEVCINVCDGKPQIIAFNEGGYCCVGIDLLGILKWVKEHPELMEKWS